MEVKLGPGRVDGRDNVTGAEISLAGFAEPSAEWECWERATRATVGMEHDCFPKHRREARWQRRGREDTSASFVLNHHIMPMVETSRMRTQQRANRSASSFEVALLQATGCSYWRLSGLTRAPLRGPSQVLYASYKNNRSSLLGRGLLGSGRRQSTSHGCEERSNAVQTASVRSLHTAQQHHEGAQYEARNGRCKRGQRHLPCACACDVVRTAGSEGGQLGPAPSVDLYVVLQSRRCLTEMFPGLVHPRYCGALTNEHFTVHSSVLSNMFELQFEPTAESVCSHGLLKYVSGAWVVVDLAALVIRIQWRNRSALQTKILLRRIRMHK